MPPIAWERLEADLDGQGCAVIEKLLDPASCRSVTGLYADNALFRKHVIMARHGYGRGETNISPTPCPA